jgi:hypothetical protein
MWTSRLAVAPATPTPTACAKTPTTRWYVQSGPAQSANETTASPNSPPSATPIVSPARPTVRKCIAILTSDYTHRGFLWHLPVLGTSEQIDPPLGQPRQHNGFDDLVGAGDHRYTYEQEHDPEH